jgi:hypothetical protein
MDLAAADSVMFDVANRLRYHPVKNDLQAARYEDNRDAAATFARTLVNNAPATSRELSLALTAVQEALMWANAAIACAP